MVATFETQNRKRNMTDSAPTKTTAKTPVASVALATGVISGLGTAILGYFDKTGLSRLLVEVGSGTSALSLAGTFLHQFGITKYGKDAEDLVKDVEDWKEDVEAELTSIWTHFDAKIEEAKAAVTPVTYPTVATGATGTPAV